MRGHDKLEEKGKFNANMLPPALTTKQARTWLMPVMALQEGT